MALKIGYLLLTFSMVVITFLIGKFTIHKTFEKSKVRKKYLLLLSGLIGWQVYIFILDQIDVLKDFSLPPRFAVYMILPTFFFTGIFIYLNRNNLWIKNLPEKWLVYIQSFRILVEILFVFTVTKGIFPPHISIEGYNFDMLFALTAPIMGYLGYEKKILSKRSIIVWNYLGLLVLASVILVFITALYKPEIYGIDVPVFPTEFTHYPYILITGFLMPLAVFFHVLSIVKLTKETY